MTTFSYRVLQVLQLDKGDRDRVQKVLPTLASGDDARKIAGRDGWGYRVLDGKGRVGVLTCRGAEVALFFRRWAFDCEQTPGDPVPEGAISDPVDAWMRLDLTGASARQARRQSRDRMLELESENRSLRLQLMALKDDTEKAKSRAATATERAKKAETSVSDQWKKKLDDEVRAARNEAAQMIPDIEKAAHRSGVAEGREEALKLLLPLADSLVRAVGTPKVGEQGLLGGMKGMLARVFAQLGSRWSCPVGQEFDPELHDAVGVAVGDPEHEGKVVGIAMPGLQMGERIVVHPQVVVGAGAGPQEAVND